MIFHEGGDYPVLPLRDILKEKGGIYENYNRINT